jgi:hypothetical protein
MLKKILGKTKIDKEYIGFIKIIYETDLIVVINYQSVININSTIIDLMDLVIKGVGLRVIYQDPSRIKIIGKISEVTKK